jgi:hypothetical protein
LEQRQQDIAIPDIGDPARDGSDLPMFFDKVLVLATHWLLAGFAMRVI